MRMAGVASGGLSVEFDGKTCSLAVIAPSDILSQVCMADCVVMSNPKDGYPGPYEPNSWGPGVAWRPWRPEPLVSFDAQVHILDAARPEMTALARVLDGAVSQADVDLRLERGAGELSQAFADVVTEACYRSPDLTRLLGVSAGPTGLRTSTVNQRAGQRIGLHVDDWDRAADPERGRARQRVCVNLGRETRYLLASPIALHKAMELWREKLSPPDLRGTEAARALLALLRPAVLRIPVPPLHAYLAPTETLVHDATTAPMTAPDLALTVLGHFDPALLSSRMPTAATLGD